MDWKDVDARIAISSFDISGGRDTRVVGFANSSGRAKINMVFWVDSSREGRDSAQYDFRTITVILRRSQNGIYQDAVSHGTAVRTDGSNLSRSSTFRAKTLAQHS